MVLFIKKLTVFILSCATVCASLAAFSACSGGGNEKKDVYSIVAEYHESGDLDVEVSVRTYAKASETNEVGFNLYPNAYRSGAKITPLKEGDASGGFSLKEVLFGDSAAEYLLSGSDENVLTVKTDRAYDEGEAISVTIKYSAKLSVSDERLSRGEGWANIGNFFPMLCVKKDGKDIECEFGAIGDPFVSEVSDFSVKLTVPSQYVVASGFDAKSCDVADDKTMYEYSATSVRDVAFAINKNFSVIDKKWGDRFVRYYYYGDDEAEKTIDLAIDALGYFSEKFGEYPYGGFVFAEAAFDAGGMEYPCFALVADDLAKEDRRFAVVHEIAHQWWYGVVGNDQTAEPFLDESLAEYSTLAFFSDNTGYGIDADAVYDATKSGCAYAEHAFSSLYPDYVGAVGRGIKGFINQYDYVNSVYSKGMLMMKAAEDAVGRKKLFASLKKYFSKYAYAIADAKDFLDCMGSARPIIETYLDGKIMLPLN